jgi:hypothetical protein
MTFQSSSTPLNQRTKDIKDKVIETYNLLANKGEFETPLDLYEKYKWGLLDDGLLYRGLGESKRKGKLLTMEEIRRLRGNKSQENKPRIHDDDELGIPIYVDEPEENGQSLRWFRANAPNSKIKREAEDEFKKRLLQLYVAHVNRTGETYFPLLEERLRTKADFYEN